MKKFPQIELPIVVFGDRRLNVNERAYLFEFIRHTLWIAGKVKCRNRTSDCVMSIEDSEGNAITKIEGYRPRHRYEAALEWACNYPKLFPLLLGRKEEILDRGIEWAKRQAEESGLCSTLKRTYTRKKAQEKKSRHRRKSSDALRAYTRPTWLEEWREKKKGAVSFIDSLNGAPQLEIPFPSLPMSTEDTNGKSSDGEEEA